MSRIIHKCISCRRFRGRLKYQKMASLPEDRSEETPPFTYCGVDYFGPFYNRVKRSDVPRYGTLFTCMTSRAIHLEVAESLDTDAFINALRRFIAIRGPIRHLRSDCGTNGAKNVLDKELAAINQTKVKDFLLHQNCDYFDFKMNFPHSSHMGGVWERQIRTVRGVLQSLLDKVGTQLNNDSLRTLFYEVMAIVNSRPLTVDKFARSFLRCPNTEPASYSKIQGRTTSTRKFRPRRSVRNKKMENECSISLTCSGPNGKLSIWPSYRNVKNGYIHNVIWRKVT